MKGKVKKVDRVDVKKWHLVRSLQAYALMAFLVLALVHLMSAFLYRSVYPLAFASIFALGAVFLLRRRRRADTPAPSLADDYARELYDKSHRRSYDWLFFTSFLISYFIFFALALSVNNSKPQELVEFMEMHVSQIGVLLIFLGINMLMARWTAPCGTEGWQTRYRAYLCILFLVSIAYWAGVLVFFGTFNTAGYTAFYGAALVYLMLAAGFTFGLRGKVLYRNLHLHPVGLGIFGAVAILGSLYLFMQRDVWLTQPYINQVANLSSHFPEVSYDEETGVYTITRSGEDFKILQLTDIHLGGSYSSYVNDMKALKACYALIEHTKPDLVVVTGDLCFPMGLASFSLNNTAPVMQFAAFMRNTGIPWAFTYGNHDTEAMAATDEKSLDSVYRSLSWKTSKNLLYPYVQPGVTGRNNQMIEVRNPDGSLNTALFLIDSNAYTGNGFNDYDFIHDDQVDWYASMVKRLCKEEGHVISSMAFFHIPLQEYKTAYQLYEEGSPEVTYYFGSNEEKMFDKVCCSDYPSKFFDVCKELGSTRAMFCGHDHYNNISLSYQGIRLTYGMSIDYLVMPGIARDTKQRGGTLITLHPDSEFEIEQVPLLSIEP